MARTHYENFPVASWLLPARMRPHVAAIYAFARTADDFADEGDLSDAERLARLDDWEKRLDGHGDHPVFVALEHTIDECRLDKQLFRDLLSAFRQDVTAKQYQTWTSLVDYCRRSANPIGRLVLGVAGYRDESLATKSDAVCTALQLVNFWQDVSRDRVKGRDYLPQDLVDQFGKGARREAGRRTRELFNEGRGIANGVTGRLKYELRATWLGGVRILERLEAVDFDPRIRPALGAADFAAIGWRMLGWRAAGK
ncbi:MAG: squalene synthase HpnC [Acidobacteria bacterium]|nr:MAG: squalene synthase HpnC [Acidobacteriota bacterium]